MPLPREMLDPTPNLFGFSRRQAPVDAVRPSIPMRGGRPATIAETRQHWENLIREESQARRSREGQPLILGLPENPEINPYAPGYDEGAARDRRLREAYERAVRGVDSEHESIQEMMGKRRR